MQNLKRELTFIDVFCLSTGAMISSGIFVLPGIAHAQAGPAVIISYLFAGLLAMTGMLSQAELVSAMPKAGGDYFYVTRSMGPAVGTVDGLLTWLSLSLKSAFALGGLAAFLSTLLNMDFHLIAVVLCLFFTILNIVGVKEAAKLQIIIVSGLLLIMVIYVFAGFPSVNIKHFEVFAPHGFHAVFFTAGLVFVSFGGLLKVASIAEEVKNPGRVIPLAMIFSLLSVCILYMLVIFVTSGVLKAEVLNQSITPISDGAFVFLGSNGKLLLSFAAVLAFVSTANAGIMAAARYPMALSRDDLLPKSLMKINERFQTPHIALVITGLIMIVAVTMNLKVLAEAASTALLLTYIFSCLCVIIMRESRVQNYQPIFRSPLYPWIQIIGIVGFVFLLFEMGIEALTISSILMAGGFFIYWFYGKIRNSQEFALLHLIERITDRELTTRSLQTELKEILHERDEVVKDRFDEIIENCVILDLQRGLTMEELFRIAAENLSNNSFSKEMIYSKLMKRELESTTVILPALAVPHIVIDGERNFSVLLVRCKEGVKFGEHADQVRTVFFLMGTRDERNFHLRVLSAIAQIIYDSEFEKRWISAMTIEDLRDLILLGKRSRESVRD